MMKNYLIVLFSAVLLAACGGGSGGGNDVISTPSTTPEPTTPEPTIPEPTTPVPTPPAPPPPAPPPPAPPPPAPPPPAPPPPVSTTPKSTTPVSTTPKSTTTQGEYENLGMWANLNQEHFSVGGPILSDDGTAWAVQGTSTGSDQNLPTDPVNDRFKYTGHVWGRVYDGFTLTSTGLHYDDGDRVRGEMSATYSVLGFSSDPDRKLEVILFNMRKEYSPTSWTALISGTKFLGDISDTATFTLSVEGLDDRYGDQETGEATGSFYGPNGEALAGTFEYVRDRHRVNGVFGGELEED